MEKINDKWIRIGGVALLSLNLLLLGIGQRDPAEAVVYVAIYLASVTLILEAGRFIILYEQRRSHGPANAVARFWRTCLFVFLSDFSLILACFYLSHLARHAHPSNSAVFFMAVFVASIVLALIQTGIYQGYYFFARLRRVEQEKEELSRINLQSQFDSLKQQVNPHFLFNSINTVSSLIDKDPQKAKKFLAEMSRVYRYLLQVNEEKLVTLETELKFVEPYFHLLKTRFNEALHLNLQIDDGYKNCLLPALTLQLLIENAIKHNVVEKDKPLVIDIRVNKEGFLAVQNNLQKKKQHIGSTKIGLANIIAKYKLLEQKEVVISESENEFTVLLPLIQNELT